MAISPATAAEIASRLGEDNAADEAVESAVSVIEAEVGPILTSEKTATIEGNFTHRLELPHGPLSAVASVLVDGVTVNADDYKVLRRGVLVFHNHVRFWGGPDSEVAVTYTAGFSEGEEPDWLLDMIELVARRRYDGVDVTQESFGTHSVTHLPTQRDGLTSQQRRTLRRRFGLSSRSFNTA